MISTATTVKVSEKIAARRQAQIEKIAARRQAQAAAATPPAPRRKRQQPEPEPAEPPLAITLLHAWEQAVAASDDEAADFAIARLKTLAQPPSREPPHDE
jgi:hypothetical protein